MKQNKRLFLLIGPKGSGKSFLGGLMQTHFGIPFLRVEDWAKTVRRGREVTDQVYVQEVFQAIEAGVRGALTTRDCMVFESTGVSDSFDQMLLNLQGDYEVITIGVQAPDDLCLHRVKTRDQSIHINVSDQQVQAINQAVAQRNLKTNFQIVNDGSSSQEETLAVLSSILEKDMV